MKDANKQIVAAHVQRNPGTFPQILGGNDHGADRFLASDNPDSDHQQEAVSMRLLWMPFFVVLLFCRQRTLCTYVPNIIRIWGS